MKDTKLMDLMASVNQMFIRYGLKSVTMDDIARELGMSKKTLYVYFRDKKDMVLKCMSNYMTEHNCKISNIYGKGQNAIDELFEVTKMVTEDLKEIKPTIFYDLKKYYPEAWKMYNNFKSGQIPEMIEANIRKGIGEGLYRENINPGIIASSYCTMMMHSFEQDAYPKEYDFKTIYHEVFTYHIHGIASEQGIAYMNEKLTKMSADN